MDQTEVRRCQEAPDCIQSGAACFWIVPAIFITYLLQRRIELFLLEIIYISAPLSFYIGFSNPKLPRSKILGPISFFPCIVNSYYILLIYSSKFQVPSVSAILLFLFLLPSFFLAYVLFIPLFSLPVIGVIYFFIFIANIVYRIFSKTHSLSKITFISIVVIFLLVFAAPLPKLILSISPLPPNTFSASAEEVYVSKYGKCYHKDPFCSGMQSPSHISLEEARKKGYSMCLKCYRNKY